MRKYKQALFLYEAPWSMINILQFVSMPLQGLSFIHNSFLQCHGFLTSQCCLVDDRWQVKISSYGLQKYRALDKRTPKGGLLIRKILTWICFRKSVLQICSGPHQNFCATTQRLAPKKEMFIGKNKDFDFFHNNNGIW